jgi:guanylate cyclase soluble subunit beta
MQAALKSFVLMNSALELLRKKAEVTMEGQFLVRQIYDDELTYNLIGAAVELLSK